MHILAPADGLIFTKLRTDMNALKYVRVVTRSKSEKKENAPSVMHKFPLYTMHKV